MKRYSTLGVLIQCLVVLQIITLSSPAHDKHTKDGEVSSDGSCSEGYNYKVPPDCTPLEDCQFVVTWKKLDHVGGKQGKQEGERKVREEGEKEEQWVEYHVQAVLSESLRKTQDVWVALGFSSNPQMGDTDVLACWYFNGSYSVHDGYNSPNGHQFSLDKDSRGLALVDSGTLLKEGGIFHCKFQRLVDTGDRAQDRLLSDKQYILLSMGALHASGEMNTDEASGDGSGTYMLKHTLEFSSDCACDVMTCSEVCPCPGGILYQLRKIHGMVMCLCFLLVFPLGSVISRYYKVVYVNTWFKLHMTVVMIGVLWSLMGLGFILTHTEGDFSVGVHQILGLFLLTLVFIQLTIGCFRPTRKNIPRRKVFQIFHRIVALSILTTSVVVMFWGMWLFHNTVMTYMMAILGLHIVFNTFFVLTLEILKCNHKFSSEPPVGYRKVTKRDELSESDEEVYVKDEPEHLLRPTYKFEKGFLLLFLVQNLVMTSLIGFLIFYF